MKKSLSNQNLNPKLSKSRNVSDHWRKIADDLKLNAQERLRIEWMIYYEKKVNKNVIMTCKHFGISRKTFYKWLNRFTGSKKNIESLRNLSRKPHITRTWEISIEEENRIIQLRKKNIHYSKKKLKVLYTKEYGEEISCWKIERVIRKHKLYPNREKQKRIAEKLIEIKEKPKRNFIKLEKKKNSGFYFT